MIAFHSASKSPYATIVRMKEIFQKPFKRLTFTILIFIVTALCAVLAIMQFRWISRAAEDERDRYYRNIMRAAPRSIDAAYTEIRILSSVIRTTLDGTEERSGELILEKALAFWREQSLYPGLLKGIWLFLPESGPRYIEAHTEEPAFLSVDPKEIPEGLNEYYQIIQKEITSIEYFQAVTALSKQAYAPLQFMTKEKRKGYAVLSIDIDIFFKDVLPQNLTVNQEEETFKIIPHAQGPHPENPEAPPFDDDDENGRYIFYPIPGFTFGTVTLRTRDGSIDPFELKERRLEFQFFGTETVPPLEPEGQQVPGFPGIQIRQWAEDNILGWLFIDLSKTEIDKRIRYWMITNTALSAGILCFLLLSLIISFGLYNRTLHLRNTEQEFVASMSHELRLPITVMQAIGDNIAHGISISSERLKEYGREISSESKRLREMVEGILLYSGFQSSNVELNHTCIDLEETVLTAVEEVSELFLDANVDFTADISITQKYIDADKNGIQRIVQNLLLNALHHAHTGEAHKTTVKLIVYQHPFRRVRISVEDNGPGIPRREQKSVFKPFFRTRRSIGRQETGSGLGLHIVKRIVELNGGSVSLQSPYNDSAGQARRGCRFSVELKYHECDTNGRENPDN